MQKSRFLQTVPVYSSPPSPQQSDTESLDISDGSSSGNDSCNGRLSPDSSVSSFVHLHLPAAGMDNLIGNELLFGVLESVETMIFCLDETGSSLLFANRAWRTRCCLDSTNWISLVHLDDFQTVFAKISQLYNRGQKISSEGISFECRLLHGDGHHSSSLSVDIPYQWMRVNVKQLQLSQRKVWMYSLVNIDKQKEAERDLVNEKNIFQATLRHLPVGVVIAKAPIGEIVFLNQSVAVNWNYKCKVFPSVNSIHDFHQFKAFRPDGQLFAMEDWPLVQSLQTGATICGQEITIERCDGTIGRLRQYSTPVFDESGTIAHAAVICEDITEKWQMEKEKMELMSREQAAREASKMKSEFLANMSHEIRTPLNGILGMTSLLHEDDSLNDAQRSSLEIIKESGTLLLTIINDILDLSKVEAGKLQLDIYPVNMPKLLQNVIAMLKHAAEKKKLQLLVEVDEKFPNNVLVDGTRLQQILINLLGNSIKFTNHGFVSISLKLLDQAGQTDSVPLILEVRDSGIGMTKETLARLFTPFMQADASMTRRFAGTGLGLSICKHLIELMNGSITVHSQLGHGTTFTIKMNLPLGKTGDDSFERDMETETNFCLDTKISVMVVDDNSLNRIMAEKTLNRLGVKNVMTAENGNEALSHFSKNNFDVILMDCQMPIMDGFECTKMIRRMESKSGKTQRVPIIALTASAFNSDRDECLQAGMNDFIAKPFAINCLKNKLAKWSSTRLVC